MKGFMKFYLHSRKNAIDIETTPDIFFKHMETYWNISIEYENGDIWFTGDASFEDGIEIGHIAMFEEENDLQQEETNI